MKTRIIRIKKRKVVRPPTIAQFARAHDLTMIVRERDRQKGDPCRFYAAFEYAEVAQGALLVGVYGDGPTPAKAIRAYANKLSKLAGGKLIIKAYSPERQEIEIPKLTVK